MKGENPNPFRSFLRFECDSAEVRHPLLGDFLVGGALSPDLGPALQLLPELLDEGAEEVEVGVPAQLHQQEPVPQVALVQHVPQGRPQLGVLEFKGVGSGFYSLFFPLPVSKCLYLGQSNPI